MKQIEWQTNYNNKLNSNKVFFHLDLAPSIGVAESKLPAPVHITTKDKSAEKKCFLLFFTRFKMQNVNDTITLLSHEKSAHDFIIEKMDADKRINWQTEMALYVYSDDENIKDFFMPVIDKIIDKI